MQAWLQLLDAGMSPALVRQVAHYRGQQSLSPPADESGRLLRSFEILFLPIALSTWLAIGLSSRWIAEHWLQAQELDTATIAQCVG